ncbi:oxidoreductase [Pasteurellaceae bacterium LFhippo2]|nr:oxidoreductase [Pasteurellaceae bacterium LFhippo2]
MFQNFAMMSLGYFVFTRQTIPYQNTSREMSWSHPSNERIGKMPVSQFTGKAGETITIDGTLMPEVTGGRFSMMALELMAEQGNAYPLISGSSFMIQGWFVIESISQNATQFFADGAPRQIDFSMQLKRVDSSTLADIADEVLGYF